MDYPHPEDPACVRGMNYASGMLCFAAKGYVRVYCFCIVNVYFKHLCRKPTTTRMVLLVQTDPRGSIPHKLIEAAVPSIQFQFFAQLRKALKDDEAHRERASKTHS